MLLVLALVAFVAGFIDAVAGGGGMLTVPALLSLGFLLTLLWGRTSWLLPLHRQLPHSLTTKTLVQTSVLGRVCSNACRRNIGHALCRCHQYGLARKSLASYYISRCAVYCIPQNATFPHQSPIPEPCPKLHKNSTCKVCRLVLRWISRSRNRRVLDCKFYGAVPSQYIARLWFSQSNELHQ